MSSLEDTIIGRYDSLKRSYSYHPYSEVARVMADRIIECYEKGDPRGIRPIVDNYLKSIAKLLDSTSEKK